MLAILFSSFRPRAETQMWAILSMIESAVEVFWCSWWMFMRDMVIGR